MKKRLIIVSMFIITVLIGTGGVLALNGYFGGGDTIPEDTFTLDLVGYWNFEEGSGTTAVDSSGNSNDGTLTNMTEDDWVAGKAGNGGALDFDGSNDHITRADDADFDFAETDDFTISAWFKHDTISAIDYIFVKAQAGTNAGYKIYMDADGDIAFAVDDDSTWTPDDIVGDDQTKNYDDNNWHYLTAVKDDTTAMYIYVDGVQIDSDTSIAATATLVNDDALYIGIDDDGSSNAWAGQLDEIKIYNRALSGAEIQFHYSRGAPVAHYKFDEGSAITANDSGSGNNTAYLFNMDASTDWVQGQFGTAIDLDGTDDVVTVANANAFDFDVDLKNAFTFSSWINADNAGENNVGEVIDKGTNTYIRVDNESSGNLDVEAKLDLATTDATLNISSAITTNQWHHIVLTYEDDADDEITLYIDGINKGSSTDGVGAPASDSNNLLIGGDSSSNFDGTIDDVRIYSYARTPDEIKLDYNAGFAAKFGGSPNKDINRGLVGYWNFEEGTGTTASDQTDNSNDGTLTLMDPPTDWVSGKAGYGGALDFDGSDDVVDAGNATNLQNVYDGGGTRVAWVSVRSDGELNVGRIFYKSGGANNTVYTTGESSGKVKIGVQHKFEGSSKGTWETTSTEVTLNEWTHIAVTYNADSADNDPIIYINSVSVPITETNTPSGARDSDVSQSQRIGNNESDTTTFDGLIDEARIYDRALSAAEVRYLYNKGGPVAHYKFDEGSAVTANDSGSGSNTAYLFNMDASTDWVQGQFGTAIDLDGTDDVVTVANANAFDFDKGLKNAFTISSWINADSDGENDVGELIDKGTNTYIRVDNESSGSLDVEAKLDLATTDATLNISAPITIDTWHHIVLTYEDDADDEITLYIDGINKGSSTDGVGAPASDSNNLLIGGDTAANFDGTIDDVRIYSYARTPDEIKLDYNAGFAAKFGGSPNKDINRGLVGYWDFEEGSGTTTNDQTENSNNGTLTSMTEDDWVAANNLADTGGALDFDGSDDYVEVSDTSTLRFDGTTEDFSIFVWFKKGRQATNEGLVTKLDASNDGWRLNTRSNDTIRCSVDAIDVVSTLTITDTNWHFIGCTIDRDGNGQMYIDGVADGTAVAISSEAMATTKDVLIGTELAASGPFQGLIDEVRIYDRALSASEIRFLYNRGGPVGHWKFDEGAGATANDSSGNANNGTITE